MQEVAIPYGRTTIQGVFLNGQFWLKGVCLTNTLGIEESSLRSLISKYKDWFGSDETMMITMPTEGGPQEVRVFSEMGAATVATLSRRPQAIPLKRWLMKRAFQRETPALPNGKPARAGHVVSLEVAKVLDFLGMYAEPGSKIDTLIKQVRSGAVRPGSDPAMAALKAKYQGANALMAEARRVYSEINREARELGYEPDAVRREAKLLGYLEEFPELPFAGDADA